MTNYISLILMGFLPMSLMAEQPKWVNNPVEFCSSNQLCAVGEATGRMGAEGEARKALSSIFRTKVKGSTDATTTSTSTIKEDVVSGSTEEEVISKVRTMTEEVLEGVEIAEFYEDSESVYALAILNKPTAAKRIKSKINDVDEDIKNLYDDGRRGSLNKALKMFSVRQNLNERYEFLSSSRYRGPVSKNMILNKKKAKAKLGTTILLKIDEISTTGEMKQVVVDSLLASDYKVVTAATLKHDFVLNTKLSAEKEYFNVKGFEKYKFLLAFEAQKKSGKKHGSIETAVTETGRDFTQAYEKALPKIRKFVSDRFDDLNID